MQRATFSGLFYNMRIFAENYIFHKGITLTQIIASYVIMADIVD